MSVTSQADTPKPAPAGRQSAGARSREATRDRLLASGVALFAKHGLNGVTTHDIAREAGVASGTFYLHFPDKGALFREIAVDAEERLRHHVEEATADARDLRDAVRSQVEALTGFAAENRELMRIVFSSESGAVASQLLDSFSRSIAEGRRDAIETGEMPKEIDASVVSQAIVGMFVRVLLWWIEDPEPVSRETLIETLTRIQLSGTHPV
jgi:AcrR family transcriptional regulator